MSEAELLDEQQLFVGSNQFLTFKVLDRVTAIKIDDVQEIIEIGSMTRIPMSSPCIRGVINLRGSVVAVVDLGCRLNGQRIHIDKRSCIVMVDVEHEDQMMGMLVSEVNEILEIEPQNMQKTPEFGTEIRSDFIAQMGRSGEEFIAILNLRRVLSVLDLGVFNDDHLLLSESIKNIEFESD